MNELSYPRPFDQIRGAVSLEESGKATDEFIPIVTSTMRQHEQKITIRHTPDNVEIRELDLISAAEDHGKVCLRLTTIEGVLSRTSIVTMAWQDVRKGASTDYYVDPDSGVVLRRDASAEVNVFRHRRLVELLGKATTEATKEELIAARMILAKEDQANHEFEREHGLNDLPVDTSEIRWLGGVLLAGYIPGEASA